MKILIIILTISSGVIALNRNVYAHDPSQHATKTSEKPKCEAIKNKNLLKNKTNDIIALALIKQCQSDNGHQQDAEHKDENGDKTHTPSLVPNS